MLEISGLDFVTVDVFTKTAFKGNQLAIVFIPSSSETLAQELKQAIAFEFNFSETVFIHEASNEENIDDAVERRLDIFTPTQELPFAGHPVIGTLFQVCSSTQPPLEHMTLRLKAGRLSGHFDIENEVAKAQIPHAFHVHQAKASREATIGTQLSARENDPAESPIVSIVKGMTFALIAVPDPQALSTLSNAAAPELSSSIELDPDWTPSAVRTYYYATPGKVTDRETTKIRTRNLNPNEGEDAATGSAASTLASYLSLQHGKSDAKYQFLIEQGVEMGRASEIQVHVTLNETGNAIKQVMIGGRAVIVTQGVLRLPRIKE